MFVALAQKGLNQVDGSLYLGTVTGGFDSWTTYWLTEDWGQEWMPPSSNLAVDKNIAQGNAVLKAFKNINLGPDTAYNAASQALLLAGESAAWVECNTSNNTLSFFRSPGMSPGAPLVVANPSAYNEALSATVASEVGVHFSNKRMKDKIFYPIVEHQSKPLAAIIQTCLYKSDNFYAQQILRTLGLGKTDVTPDPISRDYRDQMQVQPSTLESRGLARVSTWLGKIGVPSSEFVLFDGCGLSRKDGISPHTLNTVLKHMATPTVNGPYLQLLRRYSPVNKSDAWFAYKTGSMDTARSVSGVLETVGGQFCAVTIMVNGHRESVSALKGEIDSLVGILDTIKSIKFESAKPAAQSSARIKGSTTRTGPAGTIGTSSATTAAGKTSSVVGASTVGANQTGGNGSQTNGNAQGSTAQTPGEVTLVEMAHGSSQAPRTTTKAHRRRH
jgi:D-alanyl-D-alanine carboxypeptidase/D-alanyl-D-alanine-endopeptidase (penicillin-binding protein 4)